MEFASGLVGTNVAVLVAASYVTVAGVLVLPFISKTELPSIVAAFIASLNVTVTVAFVAAVLSATEPDEESSEYEQSECLPIGQHWSVKNFRNQCVPK